MDDMRTAQTAMRVASVSGKIYSKRVQRLFLVQIALTASGAKNLYALIARITIKACAGKFLDMLVNVSPIPAPVGLLGLFPPFSESYESTSRQAESPLARKVLMESQALSIRGVCTGYQARMWERHSSTACFEDLVQLWNKRYSI